MRGIIVSARGRADIRRDLELGPLVAGKVRVRLRYAGVGFADVMAMKGGYPLAPRTLFSPGYEFFGQVEEAGGPDGEAGSEGSLAGLAPGAGGGYADFAAGLAYLGARAFAAKGRGVRIVSLPAIAARAPAWCGASLSGILESAAKGELSPVVAATYAWHRAGEALEVLASGSVKGKLLLDFA